MTPNQLYQRIPEKTDHEICTLKGFNFNHVPEIESEFIPKDPTGKIEIRYYKDFYFDQRRFWRLASVWIEGKPVMIIQNAGREGDDHAKSFITDATQYSALIKHLATLTKPLAGKIENVVDPDIEIPDLTKFYGNELDGGFHPSYW
jgi:hypothetical protein